MSRKWYTIKDLILDASKIRDTYRGVEAREGQIVEVSKTYDRIKVVFDGDTEAQWTDPRQLDYCKGGSWIYGQYALDTSPDDKTMMYKIQDPNDPDVGWVIYPTRDEAVRAFEDLLENLTPGVPFIWHIEAIEMTSEEYEALPGLGR